MGWENPFELSNKQITIKFPLHRAAKGCVSSNFSLLIIWAKFYEQIDLLQHFDNSTFSWNTALCFRERIINHR